jgi:hypothetical protein
MAYLSHAADGRDTCDRHQRYVSGRPLCRFGNSGLAKDIGDYGWTFT